MSETISILNEDLKLASSPDGLSVTTDAVMLAAACAVKPGERVLDLGCGIGTAGLCVLARVADVVLTGLDIQGDHIDLAQENAAANGFEAQARFVTHDIRTFFEEGGAFDHVICNPPYLKVGTHIASPSKAKAIAMGDEACLEDWVKAAHYCVKSKGSFTLVHRADHVDQIVRALGKKFGRIEIIPLWPQAGQDAKRVIVRCLKDAKSPALLRAGLVLHEANGDYTDAAEALLRGGGFLA